MKYLALLAALLAVGCGTNTDQRETTREVVLQYLGGDFGTVGPFAKDRKKELDVLSAADKAKAAALLDEGAVGFLIYQPGAANVSRVVIVSKGHVIGDFVAPTTKGS